MKKLNYFFYKKYKHNPPIQNRMAAFIDALITLEPAALEPAALEPAALEPAALEPAALEPLKVVRDPQEGRYYYATTFTKQDQERYFTTNPLTYMGRYIGGKVIESRGKEPQEFSYFVNEKGEEVEVIHKPRTAFYHIKHLPVVRMPPDYNRPAARSLPPAILAADLVELMDIQSAQACTACQKVGHRIHTCPVKQACFDAPNEIFVVRSPVLGKYYEATFWDRREGQWDNEKHYSKTTTKREYVGQYLRTRSEGYGDGADYWAIFLRDGKEVEIEYDYDGKRAFYEVESRE